jgi:hypothetical protein
VQRLGEHVRVPGTQGLEHVGVHARLHLGGEDVLGVPVPVPIEFLEHLGGVHVEVGEGEHPLEVPHRQCRADLVSAPGADRRTADEREGHVGAQLHRERQQFLAGKFRAPQCVAGEQRGRGIRRSAAHSAGDGHVLADFEARPAPVAGLVGEQRGRPDGQVRTVPGQSGRVDRTGEVDREVVRRVGVHLFAEGDRLVCGGHFVDPVTQLRADLEEDVDLPRGSRVRHLRGGGCGHRPNLLERVV